MDSVPFSILSSISQRGLQSVDYIVVLVYFVGTLAAGIYFSRQQHEGEDFFVAGRSMPWFAVGLSLIASLMSTTTYLAAPGEVLRYGLTLIFGWLALPLAFLVVNRLWIPFFMRLNITSIYEYLEWRFGLVARLLGVGLFTLILRLFWMATIVLTASSAVAQITYPSLEQQFAWHPSLEQWTLTVLLAVGISATIYTMLGGIKAVIWTDVIQFVVLMSGLIITLLVVALDTGTGPIDWWNITTSSAVEGHALPPLASWDITERNTILFMMLNMLFWYSCTFIGDQVAVQRYLTTPSVKAAARGNIVNFMGECVAFILLSICGMALLAYYSDPRFQVEIVEGVVDPRNPLVADKVFPYFIANGLPVGMSGLLVAALFAVAMSSLDSGVNSVSTVLTIDVFRRLDLPYYRWGDLRLARILTLIIGFFCTFAGWALLYIPESYNIIGITFRTFNCALGPLGAMFAGGMFLSHVGQRAIVLSTILGIALAVCCAWHAELLWFLGDTEFSSLELHLANNRGLSPFLITPIAATSTFLMAGLLGLFLPIRDPQKAVRYSWKAVVSGDPNPT
ncbi:sodium:solute symporter family transporter [Bythopirellula goksoeyrii]|uniref:Sodium/glucose cotransporter n=1 Tax=Bythopirellula goksoeyrii TaxID=1400387 RepID=A0A5B9Q793_9BACT|nr:hypothetical protein [Bythopirellula goksoeyrii]QEG33415.1 Sodium/glucose cotransporter [Bythopirellula goksoeyrii]